MSKVYFPANIDPRALQESQEIYDEWGNESIGEFTQEHQMNCSVQIWQLLNCYMNNRYYDIVHWLI